MLRTCKKLFNKWWTLGRCQSDGHVRLSVSSHSTTDKDQAAATHTFSKLHQISNPHFWDWEICYVITMFFFRENFSKFGQEKGQRIVHYQFQQGTECVQYASWFSVFALFLCRTCFLPYFSSLLWDSCILLFNNSGLARQNNYFIKLLWFGGQKAAKATSWKA